MSFEKKRKHKKTANVITSLTSPGTPIAAIAGRDRGRIFRLIDVFTDKYGRCLLHVSRENRVYVKNVRHMCLPEEAQANMEILEG